MGPDLEADVFLLVLLSRLVLVLGLFTLGLVRGAGVSVDCERR
jgi:hypothetical protein